VLLGLILTPGSVRALTLTLSVGGPFEVNDTVDVDVLVSGPDLGDFAAPSIRSFDLDISFDTDVLAFLEVVFDPLLGTPGVEALVSDGESAGVVDLASVSILSAASLDALQPDAFRLAIVRFDAVGAGQSALELTQSIIGDSSGAPFTLDAAHGANVVVPEPGVLRLLAAGVLLLCASERRSPRPSASALDRGDRPS